MAKRTYGSGSLFLNETGTIWYAKWRQDGRQVKRRVGPARTPRKADGLTKVQAEQRMREIMAAEHAVARVEGRLSLQEAVDAWLHHLAATGAKRSTQRAYRAAMQAWWLPALKDRSLNRITTVEIEDVIVKMRRHGLVDKTVLNYVGVLRALLNWAAGKPRRWISTNPVEDIVLPKPPTYREIKYLRPDEILLLAGKAVTPADRAMYLTAGMCGLRVGELQALTWACVDFRHSRIRVRETWDPKDKEATAPKSLRGERAVPMPDQVARELLGLGEGAPGAFVFGDAETGQPRHWRPLYENLRVAQAAAGIDEQYGFHALRHGYGTALAAQGIPMRTLMEFMGHADIKTTMRYADYIPNTREREMVEAAFAAAGTNPGTNLPESNPTATRSKRSVIRSSKPDRGLIA